jgi:hypothetical protein
MHPFRLGEPDRRKGRVVCELYTSYRKNLKEDFNDRCGYCDDTDKLKLRNFAIDHFVPQNPIGFVNSIPPNDYYNLVYSCNFCNSSKSNKWPSNDEKVYNDGNEGFIDPTTVQYTNTFKRNHLGKIECNGISPNLAEYIINELKLWYPVHQITWKLERVKVQESLVKEKIKNVKDNVLKAELEKIHYDILQELEDLYENLFTKVNEK